ncbi:MAG: hypothetical protein PQJ59_16650 [Spirochaetales bacterium]|nr:hypothetical protein [Spirochaetales bacterium]
MDIRVNKKMTKLIDNISDALDYHDRMKVLTSAIAIFSHITNTIKNGGAVEITYPDGTKKQLGLDDKVES